jgi:protein-disulfide isomerase
MAQQGRNRRTRPGKPDAGGKGTPAAKGETREVRAGAAARAAERMKEREAERIRRRNITILVTIVAVVALFTVLILLINVPQEAPIPPETAARYEGISITRSPEGYPVLGEPDAVVKVSLYSSFDCPSCRTQHDEMIDPLIERIRTGRVSLTFVPLFGYGSVPNGQGAAIAALCAAEQRAFWQFHDMLFSWQGVYGNQSFANNRISAGVDALGLDAGRHRGCVNSGSAQEVLGRARSAVQSLLNFHGTPTLAINGVVPLDSEGSPIVGTENLLAAIDRELARFEVTPPVEVTPEPTPQVEATPEMTPEPTAEITPEASVPEATPEVTPEAAPQG